MRYMDNQLVKNNQMPTVYNGWRRRLILRLCEKDQKKHERLETKITTTKTTNSQQMNNPNNNFFAPYSPYPGYTGGPIWPQQPQPMPPVNGQWAPNWTNSQMMPPMQMGMPMISGNNWQASMMMPPQMSNWPAGGSMIMPPNSAWSMPALNNSFFGSGNWMMPQTQSWFNPAPNWQQPSMIMPQYSLSMPQLSSPFIMPQPQPQLQAPTFDTSNQMAAPMVTSPPTPVASAPSPAPNPPPVASTQGSKAPGGCSSKTYEVEIRLKVPENCCGRS